MNTDFYGLLGVARTASAEEIKRAYRRLARELHPDTNRDNPEAEEKFKEITLAYEILSNPETRQRYDTFGAEGIRGTGTAGAGGGDGFFGAGLGDIFDAFFGGRSPFGGGPFGGGGARRGPLRGQDAETKLVLEFDQAVFGSSTELSVKIPVACDTCAGSGARPGTTATTCATCNGTGELRRVRQSLLGQMVTASPCNACGGLGETIASPCPDCRGDGRVTRERTYTVEVPAGVDNGATLRLTERGPAGPRGGAPGDLYVHLTVRPRPGYTREGYDVVHTLTIPVTQAAFGARVTVHTLDGDEEIAVPAGTQTGKTFRLKNRGVPHVGARGRGDLIVRIHVETPTSMTKEQEELLLRFAGARGEKIDPADSSLRGKIRSAFR